jgi:NitT/TauT family transport system substrate-binding protein
MASALAGGLATGAGGSASPRRSLPHAKLTTVNIGIVPFYAYAATALGEQKGIFAHYGLNVVLQPASNINIILAEMHSGQVQLGYASTSLLATGDEKGQNVRCVAPVEDADIVIPSYPENAIMVAANSSISSLKDLNGKTVAVNQPGGSNELFLKAAVEQAGGNFSSINITTVPFADMAAALKSGAVDAAFEVPPFIQLGEKAGEQKLLADTDSLTAGLTAQCYMATNGYIQHDNAVLTRFVQAQDQAILYAKAHPALANAEIPKVSGLSAAQAKLAVPPKLVYSDNLEPSTIVKYELFMAKFGYLGGRVLPLDEVAWVAKGTPMKRLYFNTAGKYVGPPSKG